MGMVGMTVAVVVCLQRRASSAGPLRKGKGSTKGKATKGSKGKSSTKAKPTKAAPKTKGKAKGTAAGAKYSRVVTGDDAV